MTRTLTPPPGQAGLFDLAPALPAAPAPKPEQLPLPVKQPKPARPRVHPPRPRRSKDAQARDCDPRCLVCRHPEGRGLCTPRCAVVCRHTAQPDRVEVCLVTVRVTARLVTGLPGAEGPGRHLAVVDRCPWCGRVHWHAEAYGLRLRIAGCGAPYLVQLDRPRITPAEPTVEHTAATTRGANLARQLLRKDS